MIGVQVVGLDQAIGRIRRFGSEIDKAEREQARRGSIQARRLLVARMSRPAPVHPFWGKGSPAGNYLGARTGQSRQRISPGGIVVRTAGGYQAAVGSPDRHIAFAEEGGTISGGKLKRIPTAAAQTPGGADRFAGRSIRDIPGAFLIRSQAGKLWAVQPQGGAKSGRLTFLYLLVPSVKQRGRHLFRETARDLNHAAVASAQPEVARVVRRANGG